MDRMELKGKNEMISDVGRWEVGECSSCFNSPIKNVLGKRVSFSQKTQPFSLSEGTRELTCC